MSGDFVKSPCDSIRTVTPPGFPYSAIFRKPSMTRFITSSLGSPSGILSPNMRTYFTPMACARSMKRRPSSNWASRTFGSFSCIREDAPRIADVEARRGKVLLRIGQPRPGELGHLGQVHLAGDAAEFERGVAVLLGVLEDGLPTPVGAPQGRKGDGVAGRTGLCAQQRGSRREAGTERRDERTASQVGHRASEGMRADYTAVISRPRPPCPTRRKGTGGGFPAHGQGRAPSSTPISVPSHRGRRRGYNAAAVPGRPAARIQGTL